MVAALTTKSDLLISNSKQQTNDDGSTDELLKKITRAHPFFTFFFTFLLSMKEKEKKSPQTVLWLAD